MGGREGGGGIQKSEFRIQNVGKFIRRWAQMGADGRR
jgi:hypothetical protein